MRPENVRQCSGSERPSVALVNMPRRKQHLRNCLDNLGTISKREPRPFAGDFFRADARIPCQAPVAVQVRHGQRMPEPVFIQPYVNYGVESAENVEIDGTISDEVPGCR